MSELEPIKAALRLMFTRYDPHDDVYRCGRCVRESVETRRSGVHHHPDCCDQEARAVVDALPVNVAAFSKLMAQIGIGHFEAAKVIRAYKAALKG